MTKKVVLFIFVFINYFNPISIYFTLLLDAGFCFYLLSVNNSYKIKKVSFNKIILVVILFIFFWSLFIMAINDNYNLYVFGKYFRVTVASILIMIVICKMEIKSQDILPIISLIFLLHLISIGLQELFPQFDVPMAKIFGFERETDVITEMSIRKMGLSSSYDTAALISLAGMSYFFTLYLVREKIINLIVSSIFLLSTVRISRTGMVLGIVLFSFFLFYLFFSSRGLKKFIPILFLFVGGILCFYVILPIIATSTVSLIIGEQISKAEVSNNDYSTGSTMVLTESQSEGFKAPIVNLIFGFGLDPNKIPGKATDIGYIKLIYHVGIIGLLTILYLYFYFFRKAISLRKKLGRNSDDYILATFLMIYILILSIMNYKSLEIYSRGAHDFLLILFLILILSYKSVKTEITNQLIAE